MNTICVHLIVPGNVFCCCLGLIWMECFVDVFIVAVNVSVSSGTVLLSINKLSFLLANTENASI